MWIEIDDELFPPASELVGLWFDSKDEFWRCERLIWEQPDWCYYQANREDNVIAVRRTDYHIFADADLEYTEVEFIDPDDLPPGELARLQRESIKRGMEILRKRASGEQ
jgi:hypothetical protein